MDADVRTHAHALALRSPGDLLPPKPVDTLVLAEPATDAEFYAAARVQHHG
ncbi:hypothetical protein ACFU6I_24715 [Streptomyces sp. NPDC057486]|uniref:hypothetical protein n=1 Tax=Streptomyces sp. NPDC057486 TaxID=3346145 RepID=UPI0036D1E69B